jgi:serine/threonine-protein kinase
MGAVYLAARSDGTFQRLGRDQARAAHLDVGAVVRRFQREREILAASITRTSRGSSTAVAQMRARPTLSWSTSTDGRFDVWCNERALNVTRRLALFESVCTAVQHAHAHHVIHLDLKRATFSSRPTGPSSCSTSVTRKCCVPKARWRFAASPPRCST